jgi:Beta-lactamase
MISQKYLITVFLVSFLTQRSFSQLSARQSAIDTLINRSYRLGLFNGNVLITDKGKEIYRKAIGYADWSRKTPLTDQYRFHIGSIAKESSVTSYSVKNVMKPPLLSFHTIPACSPNREIHLTAWQKLI